MLINKKYLIAVIVLALVAGFGMMKTQTISTVQGGWDISEQVEDNDYTKYLVETSDFDYSNQEIQAKAQEIKSSTSSPKDALKSTIKFVASKVHYSGLISIDYCYQEKASTVLASGKGDCVSMSRLVTALLRAQGIPARTMGGCLSYFHACTPSFSLIPNLNAQITPMAVGDFKKRGALHEFVYAWTPETGWITIEATSGQSFGKVGSCASYIEFEYDTNQYDRCVINSPEFWELCRKS